jgi:hypothetical protein
MGTARTARRRDEARRSPARRGAGGAARPRAVGPGRHGRRPPATLGIFPPGIDPRQVAARTTFAGLTKASLGWTHWRRDEESQGARFFREGRAAVVPISSRLWSWLGDQAPKTTDSYTRERWSEPPHLPPPDERRDRAVRRAAELVVFGSTREVRRAFAAALSRRARGEAAWLGSLVTAVLRSTQPRKRRASGLEA